MENLRTANFAYCPCIEMNNCYFLTHLRSLKNLKSLNLSFIDLTPATFKIICEDLQTLQKLDISGTGIKDIRPLEMLSSTLVSLSLCVSCCLRFSVF